MVSQLHTKCARGAWQSAVLAGTGLPGTAHLQRRCVCVAADLDGQRQLRLEDGQRAQLACGGCGAGQVRGGGQEALQQCVAHAPCPGRRLRLPHSPGAITTYPNRGSLSSPPTGQPQQPPSSPPAASQQPPSSLPAAPQPAQPLSPPPGKMKSKRDQSSDSLFWMGEPLMMIRCTVRSCLATSVTCGGAAAGGGGGGEAQAQACTASCASQLAAAAWVRLERD